MRRGGGQARGQVLFVGGGQARGQVLLVVRIDGKKDGRGAAASTAIVGLR